MQDKLAIHQLVRVTESGERTIIHRATFNKRIGDAIVVYVANSGWPAFSMAAGDVFVCEDVTPRDYDGDIC